MKKQQHFLQNKPNKHKNNIKGSCMVQKKVSLKFTYGSRKIFFLPINRQLVAIRKLGIREFKAKDNESLSCLHGCTILPGTFEKA